MNDIQDKPHLLQLILVRKRKTICFDSNMLVVASKDAPLFRLYSYQDMYHQQNIEKLKCMSYKKINHHTRKDIRDWSCGSIKPTSVGRAQMQKISLFSVGL